MKFNINLIFLIKPFCYMTKKSRQKLKYLENEKSFWGEIKSIFHHFKGLSIAKNESAPLKKEKEATGWKKRTRENKFLWNVYNYEICKNNFSLDVNCFWKIPFSEFDLSRCLSELIFERGW